MMGNLHSGCLMEFWEEKVNVAFPGPTSAMTLPKRLIKIICCSLFLVTLYQVVGTSFSSEALLRTNRISFSFTEFCQDSSSCLLFQYIPDSNSAHFLKVGKCLATPVLRIFHISQWFLNEKSLVNKELSKSNSTHVLQETCSQMF